eukprot:930439-Prymnesium_polylepis.1
MDAAPSPRVCARLLAAHRPRQTPQLPPVTTSLHRQAPPPLLRRPTLLRGGTIPLSCARRHRLRALVQFLLPPPPTLSPPSYTCHLLLHACASRHTSLSSSR